jgi:hypothetical protein
MKGCNTKLQSSGMQTINNIPMFVKQMHQITSQQTNNVAQTCKPAANKGAASRINQAPSYKQNMYEAQHQSRRWRAFALVNLGRCASRWRRCSVLLIRAAALSCSQVKYYPPYHNAHSKKHLSQCVAWARHSEGTVL